MMKNTEITKRFQTPKDANQVFNQLEQNNRAPWLQSYQETIKSRAKVFPQGQLLIIDKTTGNLIASLSMNRIRRDGSKENISSRDEIAGSPSDYSKTYKPDGNTLTLMSMNVSPNYQGQGYARKMIEYAKETAKLLGVENIIGSFRPNNFGDYKLKKSGTSFEEYIQKTNEQGFPIDGRLRNLNHNGMVPLKVDYKAMCVEIPIKDFQKLKNTYKPEVWKEIENGVFECGETGQRKLDKEKGVAIYTESNLRGQVPLSSNDIPGTNDSRSKKCQTLFM